MNYLTVLYSEEYYPRKENIHDIYKKIDWAEYEEIKAKRTDIGGGKFRFKLYGEEEDDDLYIDMEYCENLDAYMVITKETFLRADLNGINVLYLVEFVKIVKKN